MNLFMVYNLIDGVLSVELEYCKSLLGSNLAFGNIMFLDLFVHIAGREKGLGMALFLENEQGQNFQVSKGF
jgi:hypothetical protein